MCCIRRGIWNASIALTKTNSLGFAVLFDIDLRRCAFFTLFTRVSCRIRLPWILSFLLLPLSDLSTSDAFIHSINPSINRAGTEKVDQHLLDIQWHRTHVCVHTIHRQPHIVHNRTRHALEKTAPRRARLNHNCFALNRICRAAPPPVIQASPVNFKNWKANGCNKFSWNAEIVGRSSSAPNAACFYPKPSTTTFFPFISLNFASTGLWRVGVDRPL